MSSEAAATFECTQEPPHRFAIAEKVRHRQGILLTLQRLDAAYPLREMFITNREMKMGYDSVYKACYVCVDRGMKETAIVLPKAELEAGLPAAS